MSHNLRIAYFSHTLRSDWNNGNAHFLRGLLDNLRQLHEEVRCFEPEEEWSLQNLRNEELGAESLRQFDQLYPDLDIVQYRQDYRAGSFRFKEMLKDTDVVILHEWNSQELARTLLKLRDEENALHYKLLFHDTHHRASSTPEAIAQFGTNRFDGVLTFGDALTHIYRDRFGLKNVWTLHEAADTRLFHPIPNTPKNQDMVWIGNWGDNERSEEIRGFLLEPAANLRPHKTTIYGVRYPEDGLQALAQAGVRYGGYLPNLQAPHEYAAAHLTIHIPRQQYTTAMQGIPTIRVFEALACGIPLISAPWQDTEHLFRPGDFLFAHTPAEMQAAMHRLLENPTEAACQAQRGLETVLARHTCRHRAEQLTSILEEDVLP